MSKEKFEYIYASANQKEIEKISAKYIVKESKWDELKRLDKIVEKSGQLESIVIGVLGVLLLGIGMCFSMQIIGTGIFIVPMGIVVFMVGLLIMAVAYPLYLKKQKKAKKEYAQRIIELADELMV